VKKLYKNAHIYAELNTGERSLAHGWLLTDGEIISAVGFGEPGGGFGKIDKIVDLDGACLVPGLIDVHTHGRAGGDFNTADVDMMVKMSRSYLESGVTGLLPTLASDTLDGLHRSICDIAEAKEQGADNFIGVHLEGRYLNKKRRGAHAESLLAPLDGDEVGSLIIEMKKVGRAHVSAALELDEDGAFLSAALENGATVGLAHTGADYAEAQSAFERGATSLTHTFNAMTPLHHRDGGVIAAALNNDEVYCELIADGFHIAPQVVKLLYNMKGDHTVLITDSMEATGCPDGEYSIAGLPVTVKDGKARTHEGAIAGSTLSLIDGVKNLSSFADIRFEDALYCATASPAMMMGAYESVGSLDVGKRANMLVLDEQFNVKEVILDGNKVK
jgi:N-acetylglucosamine-6-phosphate deacetylase